MQPMPVFNTQLVVWPLLLLIAGAIFVGIVAAIRHGYGKVVLIGGAVSLAGLIVGGFSSTDIQNQNAPTVHPSKGQIVYNNPDASFYRFQFLDIAVGFGIAALIGGYMIRHGHWKAVVSIGGCALAAAIVLPAVQQVREAERRAHQVNDLKQLGQQLHARHDTAMVLAAAPESPPSGPTPSQILYTTGNAQPISIQELPGWRKNPPHEGTLGAGRAKYVLTSQQFATVEEAEAELFKSLTVDVQESFAKYYSPAVGWNPTPEDLRLSGIIAERVVETFSVKVGEFENPVHRVSWLIEFDHDKSTVLLQRWEPIEAQRRSKLILSILAGASGVLGVTAMALRRRRDQPAPVEATASGAA